MSRRGPGAPIPPTLVYAAGFFAGWWLDRSWPWPMAAGGAGTLQMATGWAAIAVGLWLFAWGMTTFARARTGIMLQQDATLIVERGPYRFSRNPMYVGFTSFYVGLVLVLNIVWPILLLPLVHIVLTVAVIAREERYMRQRFGADYEAYCRRVRRWL